MSIFSITTKNEQVNSVLNRWRERYRKYIKPPITRELEGLYANNLQTEASINEIIGNDSWTRLECFNCEKNVDVIIILEYYENYIQVCAPCLNAVIEEQK